MTMEAEPWYKKCVRCKNLMFGICAADVTIKQFAENGSICPLWEEKTMEIKPCPFCGSKRIRINSTREDREEEDKLQTYWGLCMDCGADGPNAESAEEAVRMWNERMEPEPPKEDVQ